MAQKHDQKYMKIMDTKALHKLNEDFLKAFPLESLKEMTLEQYTNLNKSDSFCYWLETKTQMLGGIGGGSSFKFGIYRCKNKPKEGKIAFRYDGQYAWRHALGKTADEAYEKVKDVVVKSAASGHESNLAAIESITGNVIDSHIKWKIAFLYSEESIIPYYGHDRLKYIGRKLGMASAAKATIADIQKFLISKRDGRDIFEYGKLLDDIYKKSGQDSDESEAKTSVWMWLGDDNTFNQERLTAGDTVSDQIRDYEKYTSYEIMRDDVQKAVGNTDVSVPHAYWRFMKDIQIGDIVVVFKNKRVRNANHHVMYGWGIFTSDFINDKQSASPLQRCVEWKVKLDTPIETSTVKNTLFFHGTTKEQATEIKLLLGIGYGETKNPVTNMEYQSYIELLKETHNLVLTGSPGTGKTYMAQQIAIAMGAVPEFVQFHPSYDYSDFVEGLRPIEKGDGQMGFERRDGVFKAFCAKALQAPVEAAGKEMNISDETALQLFKNDLKKKGEIVIPSYLGPNSVPRTVCLSQNDTITIRGESNSVHSDKRILKYMRTKNREELGTDTYTVSIGEHVLKEYKQKSSTTTGRQKPYVFIIDEINRGEASKIFGELFFAIDPGYRGKKDILVQTQYQNLVPETDVFAEGFYVPENVYILATMNDIDRSVESMDFAMRRRFTWHEITPADTESMLDNLPCVDKAKETMHRLNDAIDETDGLGPAYMIGPAYFLKLKDNGSDFVKLWNMNIEPLLREYLRGFRKYEEYLKKFKKAYFKKENDTETEADNAE